MICRVNSILAAALALGLIRAGQPAPADPCCAESSTFSINNYQSCAESPAFSIDNSECCAESVSFSIDTRDGDVDLEDFVRFQLCFTGPKGAGGFAGIGNGCETADLDEDGDVDVADFHLFLQDFTGPRE